MFVSTSRDDNLALSKESNSQEHSIFNQKFSKVFSRYFLQVSLSGEVAINYLNSTNYMFFGGLIMAVAVEHSGLHNRVALRIIMMVGTSQVQFFKSNSVVISDISRQDSCSGS